VSYDLYGYRVPAGMTAKALVESDDPEALCEPMPAEDRERLAEALVGIDPSAERIDGEDFIELDADGMQVFLYETESAINVPYHATGAEGEAVMERAFAYAEVMTRVGGLTMWDPQTEEVVGSPGHDPAAAAEQFGATSQVVEDMAGERPSRWRFWKRR